jgi:hypothetical protein
MMMMMMVMIRRRRRRRRTTTTTTTMMMTSDYDKKGMNRPPSGTPKKYSLSVVSCGSSVLSRAERASRRER